MLFRLCILKNGLSRRLQSIWKKVKKTVRRWVGRSNVKDKARTIKNINLCKRRNIIRSIKKNGSSRKTGRDVGLSHTTVLKMVRRKKSNPCGLFPYKTCSFFENK